MLLNVNEVVALAVLSLVGEGVWDWKGVFMEEFVARFEELENVDQLVVSRVLRGLLLAFLWLVRAVVAEELETALALGVIADVLGRGVVLFRFVVAENFLNSGYL